MSEGLAGRRPPEDPDPLRRLREIVKVLRAPGGCPWDREQTHQSLVPHLLEEAYEAAEAIRRDCPVSMQEELGDLLLQVVLHAEIAEESLRFDLDAIAAGIADKLVRRHPHVFGGSDARDTEAVLWQWEAIKAAEKGEVEAPYLAGVGVGLPALLAAVKLQKRAARAGFDWPDQAPVLEKVREELEEVESALEAGGREAIAEELGDLLFAVVNLARWQRMDPEELLSAANTKFRDRLHRVEERLRARGRTLEAAAAAELDAEWEATKAERAGAGG